MLASMVTLAGGTALAIGVIALIYVAGMRRKARWVQQPIIRISRALINPRQMRTAGTPGAYASVIQHRGRTSGRSYETPVGAVATDDGFVIALPYGSRVSWLRNVIASRSATIRHEGQTFVVDQPEIVPMAAVEQFFAPGERRTHRVFGVDQCLRLQRAQPQLGEAA
jgi:deazaflavin-dependent oxidoreductase (nitroreductase family)